MTVLLKSSLSGIQKGIELLKQGEVIAFPTETVYGLGAPIFSVESIKTIFQIKQRPPDNPLIAHISSPDQIKLIAQKIPPLFHLLSEAFFPGPLTILLPKHESVPAIASAGLSTLGVRMPSHPVARRLIEGVGIPLVAPSANLSGHPSSTTAQHVIDDFNGKIAAVIDGGPSFFGLESTVISLAPDPILLRPGVITKEEIEKVLKRPLLMAQLESQNAPPSPGMKYRHYAPKAKLSLFETKKDLESYLATAPSLKRKTLTSLKPEELYLRLREADQQECEEILVLCEKIAGNLALMNRLQRAADYPKQKVEMKV
ncbi:MAG: L-threonylcarbamoyladenylate synthase [Chlamydiales bacterium]